MNSKAFDIDFLSISSIIIRRPSFPLKNINGIWQDKTTKNIALKSLDSNGHYSGSSGEHSSPKLSRIEECSLIPLPKL